MSIKSINAIENLRKICDDHLAGNFELEIIDISKQKHQAANYNIIGVPTLIKIEPAPKRMVLGDMADINKVLEILNITH